MIKKVIFLEHFHAAHSYRLLDEFPGKNGERQDQIHYCISCKKNKVLAYQRLISCGRSAHIHTKENAAVAKELVFGQEGRPHTRHQEMSLQVSCLVINTIRHDLGLKSCLKRCHAKELNEINCLAFIKRYLWLLNSHETPQSS